MKLTRTYEEGSDIGVRFEAGDEFWVRKRFTNRPSETVFCEVVEVEGRIVLKAKAPANV